MQEEGEFIFIEGEEVYPIGELHAYNVFMEQAEQPEVPPPKLKKPSKNSASRGPYNNYEVTQKQQAVDLLNSGESLSNISKKLSIPAKNIKRWQKQGVFRKAGAGRKRCDPDM